MWVGRIQVLMTTGGNKMSKTTGFKIEIIRNQIVMVTPGITVDELKRAEAVAPDSLTLKDENGGELFKVSLGAEPSISKYGMVVSEKRDIVIVYDKPCKKEKIEEEYAVAILRAPLLIAQIKEAIKGSDKAMEGIVTEVTA